MAFDANAKRALPEFVYINLDICKKNKTIGEESQFRRCLNNSTKVPAPSYKIYLGYSHILWELQGSALRRFVYLCNLPKF